MAKGKKSHRQRAVAHPEAETERNARRYINALSKKTTSALHPTVQQLRSEPAPVMSRVLEGLAHLDHARSALVGEPFPRSHRAFARPFWNARTLEAELRWSGV